PLTRAFLSPSPITSSLLRTNGTDARAALQRARRWALRILPPTGGGLSFLPSAGETLPAVNDPQLESSVRPCDAMAQALHRRSQHRRAHCCRWLKQEPPASGGNRYREAGRGTDGRTAQQGSPRARGFVEGVEGWTDRNGPRP